MSLKAKLTDDMKTAMKGGEKDRLATIRLINAAIKQREVDERIVLDDAQVLAVLEKMLKQRRDSISQFEAAGRDDLVAKESFELGVIESYLPQKLSDAELDMLIGAAIAETGAAGPKDMGKVIAAAKTKAAGRADMGKLSEKVKARLASASGDIQVDDTDGVRVTTPDGWWLLRASNTQDVLVARAESYTDEGLERLLAQIDAQLEASGLERGPQAGH